MKYIKYIILGIICFSVGDFEDATTTPIAIQNPFSATSSTKTYIVNNVNAGTNSQETIS